MVQNSIYLASAPFLLTFATIILGWLTFSDVNRKPTRFDGQLHAVNASRIRGSATDHLHTQSSGPQKLIIFAYMRSGSSFVGEISRQNPEHMFWFEPVDAIYSHLYGTRLGWLPLDITNFINGSRRPLPDYERKVLRDSILDLLNCNFNKVPLEVLATRTRNGNNSWSFSSCRTREFLNKKNQKGGKRAIVLPNNTEEIASQEASEEDETYQQKRVGYIPDRRYKDITQCKGFIRGKCPQQFTGTADDKMVKCYKALHGSRDRDNPENEYIHHPKQMNYNHCLKKYEDINAKCLHHLYSQCSRSEANTIKTVRLTMDTIEDVLNKDPSVKVIYLLRDPRAIVTSRNIQLISKAARFKSKPGDLDQYVVQEARMLCSKMMHDIVKSNNLSKRFPNRIQEARYEHVAQRPLEMFRSLYDSLNFSNFNVIDQWFKAVSQTLVDGKRYDTKRKNSTLTASQWQRHMTLWTAKAVEGVCVDVLKYLGL